MRIRKSVITVAGRGQRRLPLQTVVDQDGQPKPVVRILIEECLEARIEEIGLVIRPGDEGAYRQAAGDHAGRLTLIEQPEPLGYGNAVACARRFAAGEPILHLVGDHLYVRRQEQGCARQLVELAGEQNCSVSAVQPTRESLLPHFGTVGAQRVPGRPGLYRVSTVIEKPTPTEAEQKLVVPGLRSGHYLCFFGMHVLTPAIFDLLDGPPPAATLSAALAVLAAHEQYLALEQTGTRYDLGTRYGLLYAQLALALAGKDRDEVLAHLVEMLATRGSAV